MREALPRDGPVDGRDARRGRAADGLEQDGVTAVGLARLDERLAERPARVGAGEHVGLEAARGVDRLARARRTASCTSPACISA